MIIRTARTSDAPGIAAIYEPIVRDTFISFETEPPSSQEMAERIENTLKSHPWLVAESDGGVIGYAYAGPHRTRPAYQWSCDVSVYLAPGSKRTGTGRKLYSRLFEILGRQGFAMAFAGIALPNGASVGFHEAMGFEFIGQYPRVGFKKGEWRDVGWWHRPIQELGTAPREPLGFAEVGKR